VPAAEAGRLWREAAEERTATALEGRSKTVRTGSLRRVELIPPGSLFLSLVTSLDPQREPKLDTPLQVGAGESLGWGWIRWSEVGPGDPGAPSPAARLAPPAEDPGNVLAQAYAAVEGLAGESPELRAKVRAVVQGFGPRATYSGFAAALAFHSAKAKPAKAPTSPGAELSADVRAHRWLLAALRDPVAPPPSRTAPDDELRAWLREEERFSATGLAAFEEEAMTRWRALRRAVELGLATGEESGGSRE
jgi:hypothetical protein